jgi:hypothetical protein
VGIDPLGVVAATSGRGRRLRTWCASHLPELAVLLLGVLLRVSMPTGFDTRVGFDFNAHWPYINYLVSKHALPPLAFNTTTYHPPLYYLICALLVGCGLDAGALGWLAALLGIARLVVIWVGLERWLPESRLARVIALATAALIPAALQLDGMITNETLSILLCALALVAAPAAIRGARTGVLRPVVWLAVWVGLALITKVSATMLVLAVVLAVGREIAVAGAGWRPALRARARSLAMGGAVVVALAGWFFVRNQILYGEPSPTGYEGWAKKNQAPFELIPYLDRRTVGFFVGFDPDVFQDPYAPTGYRPHPRFFSVLLASTFCDFYNYSLFRPDPGRAVIVRDSRTLPAWSLPLSQASVVGGAIIAFIVLLSWLAAARALWRRPDDPRLILLLVPALALLGQLHFATKYPNDNFGPIKGAYLQFAAPVAGGLFGLGVGWMWRRTWARSGAVVAMAALGLVAVYTIAARLPRTPAPFSTPAPFRRASPDAAVP